MLTEAELAELGELANKTERVVTGDDLHYSWRCLKPLLADVREMREVLASDGVYKLLKDGYVPVIVSLTEIQAALSLILELRKRKEQEDAD